MACRSWASRTVGSSTTRASSPKSRTVSLVACGHGAAEFLQVVAGPRVRLGQAAVELVDRLVGDVDQRLVEEGHQERIPPFFRHPLQGLAGGPASDLGQALEPVGAQAVERPAARRPHPSGIRASRCCAGWPSASWRRPRGGARSARSLRGRHRGRAGRRAGPCVSSDSKGVRMRKVSCWASCWAATTSRSRQVRPGRTILSVRSFSQASWKSRVGRSCSRARSTSQVLRALRSLGRALRKPRWARTS